uniref:disintegrin and metalloproteinase domain-containing protein 25-like n=1 Tax=Jaculus jaculus TaxID=51337 RepID=UPI001E1B37BB|nr:disintegrin and metalloproteinase domain-containing protein 25-like [Jaculus jaculus]
MDSASRESIKGQCCMQPNQRRIQEAGSPTTRSLLPLQDMVAVDEALLHIRISDLHLWLGIWFFLSAWPLSGHAQLHSSLEVVIPLRVSGTSRGMRSPGWLTYSLYFGGQKHIMQLRVKKFLISRHLSVFTYTEQGNLHEDQPFIPKDCYYYGYVDGDPESLVSLTTCLGGFQGTLHINNTVYEIKPKSPSSIFEHLVYKMDSGETEVPPMRCRLTEEDIARQMKLQESANSMLMQSDYKGWFTHRWFIELAVVIDHNRFIHLNGNLSNLVQEIFTIVNEMNSLFTSLDVNIVLLAIEVWNKGNPVPVDNIESLLGNFCFWKFISFSFRTHHDIAQVFVHKDYGIDIGYAYLSGVCHPNLNCGVITLILENLAMVALTATHEMGHNLGMKHDEHTCTCGQGGCIMSPVANNAWKFSNCSYSDFIEQTAKKTCMRNAPNESHIFSWSFCGNGFVEDGEECDCGSSMLCEEDPCCMVGCVLRYGAECAFGLCCKDCLFMPRGTMCRQRYNECDLPEWCNGTSHKCPEDVYVQDGSPCKDGGYCYEKRCNQRDEQCRQIFGKEAKSANQTCYREMNTRGDRFGNCGATSEKYLSCDISNILCGRVQCENVAEIPSMQDHSTVHWNHFNGVTCWSTDHHWGMPLPDVGNVKDGTGCGEDHVCINSKCVRKSIWRSDCSLDTCNRKGACNNKHHCHCDLGWSPPQCLIQGSGGSVDSGPPPERKPAENVTRTHNSVGMYVWIAFCFLLFCLLICLYIKVKLSPKRQESNVQTLPEAEKVDDEPWKEEYKVKTSDGTEEKITPNS